MDYLPDVWIIYQMYGLFTRCMDYLPDVWIIYQMYGLFTRCMDYLPDVWIIYQMYGLFTYMKGEKWPRHEPRGHGASGFCLGMDSLIFGWGGCLRGVSSKTNLGKT